MAYPDQLPFPPSPSIPTFLDTMYPNISGIPFFALPSRAKHIAAIHAGNVRNAQQFSYTYCGAATWIDLFKVEQRGRGSHNISVCFNVSCWGARGSLQCDFSARFLRGTIICKKKKKRKNRAAFHRAFHPDCDDPPLRGEVNRRNEPPEHCDVVVCGNNNSRQQKLAHLNDEPSRIRGRRVLFFASLPGCCVFEAGGDLHQNE